MNLVEFRNHMERCREMADNEAAASKDSYLVLERLSNLYQVSDAHERAMADRVLCEWALAEDDTVRFDALALIDKFRISSAKPALQNLARRLAARHDPASYYETLKIARIMEAIDPKGS